MTLSCNLELLRSSYKELKKETRRWGDTETFQKGIQTPPEMKPLNREIQWGIETLGHSRACAFHVPRLLVDLGDRFTDRV